MKMLWIFLGCLVFISLVNCSILRDQIRAPHLGDCQYWRGQTYGGRPYRQINIWVDYQFGEADFLSIEDAVRTWNFVLNGYIKLNIMGKADRRNVGVGWLFLQVNHTDPLVVARPELDVGYWNIGFADEKKGYLYLIRDRLQNEDVYGLMLHEIGHLLGVQHQVGGLMYPHYTRAGYQCVDALTVWQVAVKWGLPADHLNYCVNGEKIKLPANLENGAGDLLK